MNNTFKKLEIFVIVVIIAVIGIIYAFRQKPAPSSDTSAATSLMSQTGAIEYSGQDGKNALELLQAGHQVDAKHYSFGDMVTAIDGLAADANHFWAMYVNGEFSQVGASSYMTKSSDVIKWQLDEVNNE